MPHYAEHELLSYLDDELPRAERQAVARHLDLCDECVSKYRGLRLAAERLTVALQLIDRPPPQLEAAALLGKKESRGRLIWAYPALAKAAVLLLAIGGASAAAIPGSPLRSWVGTAWTEARSFLGIGSDPSAEPARPEAVPSATSRVSVAPLAGRVRVNIVDPSPETLVRVRLVDESQATVSAPGARYRTGAGWIEVHDPGPAEIVIELPRSATTATIEVNGRPAAVKLGSNLQRVGAPSEGSGSELLFRPAR